MLDKFLIRTYLVLRNCLPYQQKNTITKDRKLGSERFTCARTENSQNQLSSIRCVEENSSLLSLDVTVMKCPTRNISRDIFFMGNAVLSYNPERRRTLASDV